MEGGAPTATVGKLKHGITCGNYRLVEKTNCKSSVWEKFLTVVDSRTSVPEGHVQCRSCKSFFVYDSSKTGTSHLSRHKCKASTNSASISSFLSPQCPKPPVPADVKEKVTTACARLCAKDMRPFDVVSGSGFKAVAEELIQIGAKYGKVNAEDILPHPTTVSRKVAEVAGALRESIMPEILLALNEGRCAITTDMWTDDFKKIAYTTATAHYIDSNWSMHCRVVFTCDFPSERKTGDNIRKELVRRFMKLGVCDAALKKATFVTDQGANIVCALQAYDRMDCSAHVLNTILRNTFAEDFVTNEVPLVSETVQATKAVVTFLKQSGLASQLKQTVSQEVPTRWNSKVSMLKSVCSQFEEIEALLETRNNPVMESVNKTTLNKLIEFLQPFKDASDALEEEKRPTLPLVVLYASTLKKHLEHAPVSAVEAVEIEKLKARARHFLDTKLKISLLHKTATFLWPQFRQLRMLPEDERLEVYAHVKELLAHVTETMTHDEDETNDDVREPASKRTCLGLFQDWCDAEDDNVATDELEEYLHGRKDYSCSSVSELCDFWRAHEKEFPKLSLLSKRILCIPATSASSERNFSAAGYIMQARRTCLKKETMDNLLFLHKNM